MESFYCVCLFIEIVFMAFALGQIAAVHDCPEDWMEWSQSCYKVTPTAMLWRDVRPWCQNLGARMAVPSSKEENTFLAQLATAVNSDLWIDCTDEEEEGRWVCSEDLLGRDTAIGT